MHSLGTARSVPRRSLFLSTMKNTTDGFDVAAFRLDFEEYPGRLPGLKRLCNQVLFKNEPKPYQPGMKSLLELHQPSRAALLQLQHDLGGFVTAPLDYLEVARDFLAPDPKTASILRGMLLRSIALPYQRTSVATSPENPGTIYWRKRPERGLNLVLYADGASKINGTCAEAVGMDCAHLEMRLYGSAALATYGIVTIDDLISFDYEDFWARALRWHRMPRVTEIGRAVAGPERARMLSGTHLRNIGNETLIASAFRVDGQFSFQNTALKHPSLLQDVPTISPFAWAAHAFKSV